MSSSPKDVFRYERTGKLSVDGVSLEQIAEAVGTPFYVYSRDSILNSLRELQDGLRAVDGLVCFAVKACSNIHLLELLGKAGAGADLVSGGELHRAKVASLPGRKLVLSGVGKTPGEMLAGLEADLHSFNVESLPELELLNAIAEQEGRRARVALRLNPDVDAKTHPYISTGLKHDKFGLDRKEILSIAKSHADFPGIEFCGLSIHIGSQLTSLRPLDAAFAKTRSMIQELDALLPAPLSFVDLGGGLGITYKSEKPPRVRDYLRLILKHFGPKGALKRKIQVIIEPGRSLVGNAGALVTEVLYRKTRGKKQFVIVDAGMNDLIRPALYESYHDIIPTERALTRGKSLKTDIVGPVCESGDCFASERPLSERVSAGDLLAILSAGAYGHSMASNYNTRPRPPEVLVENGTFRLIRKRETYADLLEAERF